MRKNRSNNREQHWAQDLDYDSEFEPTGGWTSWSSVISRKAIVSNVTVGCYQKSSRTKVEAVLSKLALVEIGAQLPGKPQTLGICHVHDALTTSSTEISVVKQKYDELLTKSLLTRSQFEGQLKEKTKVISDLKVKEGKDIDTMIEMAKQINFLNEIHYKLNQTIQTISKLSPNAQRIKDNSQVQSVSRPQLKSYQVKEKVVPNISRVNLQSSNSRTSNANAVCAECGKCVFNSNHDACVSRYLKGSNMSNVPVVPLTLLQIVQLILFIVDSGCTKHMTGNLKLLCNSVEKFLGLVLHQMTSIRNRSELEFQYRRANEPSSSKLVPKVVPLAVKTAASRQELELLFHHHIAMPRTTDMAGIEKRHHGPSDAMHNPSQPFGFLLTETGSFVHGEYTRFIEHLIPKIVDIELGGKFTKLLARVLTQYQVLIFARTFQVILFRSDLVEITDVSMWVFFIISKKLLVLDKIQKTMLDLKVIRGDFRNNYRILVPLGGCFEALLHSTIIQPSWTMGKDYQVFLKIRLNSQKANDRRFLELEYG
ncbi:hypothetical protein Tco_1201714 [Tanacetum coccineum]